MTAILTEVNFFRTVRWVPTEFVTLFWVDQVPKQLVHAFGHLVGHGLVRYRVLHLFLDIGPLSMRHLPTHRLSIFHADSITFHAFIIQKRERSWLLNRASLGLARALGRLLDFLAEHALEGTQDFLLVVAAQKLGKLGYLLTLLAAGNELLAVKLKFNFVLSLSKLHLAEFI